MNILSPRNYLTATQFRQLEGKLFSAICSTSHTWCHIHVVIYIELSIHPLRNLCEIAAYLTNSSSTRVPDTKSLSCNTSEVGGPPGCSVQANIAYNDIILSFKVIWHVLGRVHDNGTTTQTLRKIHTEIENEY